MRKGKVYSVLAQYAVAYQNCKESSQPHLKDAMVSHRQMAEAIAERWLPSGSGIDSGTKLDIFSSNDSKLVFQMDFHHMDQNGFYDGWSHHKVTVRPSLAFGFNVSIGGRDRNQIKDYLAETLDAALHQEIEWSEEKQAYLAVPEQV